MYKQPIIIFGIAIPLFICALVLGACVYVRGEIHASFANKERHYEGHEASRLGALGLEAQVSRQRGDFERWNEQLSQETFSLVTTNIRAIAETLPPKEFQVTAFERLGESGGFASITAQKSSNLRFNFRGTFRTVQQAFLELESRMPNLQLQDLRIDPNTAADSSQLNFQVTYTAWEN